VAVVMTKERRWVWQTLVAVAVVAREQVKVALE
jgi:hypothetical protein